jgi:hypothetical protein
MDIMSGSGYTCICSLTAAIFDFSTSGLGAQYSNKFQWITELKSTGLVSITVGNTSAVLRLPSWIIHFWFGFDSIRASPVNLLDPRNTSVATGILLIVCL